jgi:hypothetical protein
VLLWVEQSGDSAVEVIDGAYIVWAARFAVLWMSRDTEPGIRPIVSFDVLNSCTKKHVRHRNNFKTAGCSSSERREIVEQKCTRSITCTLLCCCRTPKTSLNTVATKKRRTYPRRTLCGKIEVYCRTELVLWEFISCTILIAFGDVQPATRCCHGGHHGATFQQLPAKCCACQ